MLKNDRRKIYDVYTIYALIKWRLTMTMTTQAINERVGSVQVTGNVNKHAAKSIPAKVADVLNTGKGLADFYGILDKGSQVVDLATMAQWAPWTKQIGGQAKVCRNFAAVPYLLQVGLNLKKDPSLRTTLEFVKIGGYAAAAVMPTNGAQAANVGSVAGVALDVVDMRNEVKMYQACKGASTQPMAAATKSVIDRHITTGAAKILKLALCLFAGLVSIAGSIFGMAISSGLATAALVAGLGGLLISFGLSYADLSAPFKAKVAILPTAPAVAQTV